MCQGLLTTKEEWMRTRDRGEAVPAMELLLLDPELGEGKIVFKLWEMNKPNGTTSYITGTMWLRSMGLRQGKWFKCGGLGWERMSQGG
ncbi:unnamed protein product [Linum trigynum]|uniref:Uncharacterized protein n=1 Tax=Linum trigynum TaxID=586398 RepID=A0AAV2F6I6_9ROSI